MMVMALKHEPGKMFRSLCYPDNWCDFHCKAVESFVAFHCILRFAVDRMGRFPTVSAWRANPLLLWCKGRSTQLEAQLHSPQPLFNGGFGGNLHWNCGAESQHLFRQLAFVVDFCLVSFLWSLAACHMAQIAQIVESATWETQSNPTAYLNIFAIWLVSIGNTPTKGYTWHWAYNKQKSQRKHVMDGS